MEKKEFIIEENGIYKNQVGNLVKVIKFDRKTNMIHLFNISEQCNQHLQHREDRLVSRVR
jgi:hypothetical protein